MATAATTNPRTIFGGATRRKMVGRMGPWQLVQLIAESSLSRVYAARPADSPDAPPSYAVKALKREWWQDRTAIDIYRREAWVGRQASHSNLIAVLGSQVAQPPFWIAHPRLTGDTLETKLRGGWRPSLPEALWITRQAADALAALYRQTGMIHADVKPSNLFLAPDGHVTLLDLGLCQTASEARNWTSRPVVGTPRYMAPEMFTSACSADARSDLYSLGATLYEMLAGRPPFDASEPAELISQHRQDKPACIRDAAPGTAKPVASLVHRLLAKDPLRRPDSAEAVADELARLEIACFAYR